VPNRIPDPQEVRIRPKTIAVVFDRSHHGFYVYNLADWGPMAMRPADKALFRADLPSHEIRQFTLNLDSGL
jgi:hypothetical protein